MLHCFNVWSQTLLVVVMTLLSVVMTFNDDDINSGDDVDGNDVSSGGEVCTDHSGERFW